MLTKEKTLLFEGSPLYAGLTWSKKDWIIFHRGTLGLYRMKGNGDSLTPIECSVPIHHPKWNWDGTKFCAYRAFGTGEKYSLIFNDSYEIIDTLMGVYSGIWQHPEYIANVEIFKIELINPETKEVEYKITSKHPYMFGGFAWGEGNKIIYTTFGGTYIHNLETNRRKKIRCGCDTKFYGPGSTTRSRTKILYKVNYSKVTSPGLIETKPKMVLMNMDGSGEEIIEIPE